MTDAPQDPTTAIRTAIQQLADITDPTTRALALGTLLDAWPDLHSEVRQARQEAVAEMRETMTVTAIGEALGIGQPRASQILRGVTKNKK
ncbi:RNA polymerase subunit sigma-70 [Streptomyces sp. NPDC005953]|uniref:RNA polymerase subunit sigma-70 n=1 Tax=Streptomyces sp. NPDC005953 TaxID=3156719 RepID=UPI0033E50B15